MRIPKTRINRSHIPKLSLRVPQKTLANPLAQLTIAVSTHVEKACVWHSPPVRVFLVLYPSDPVVYGNPPFVLVSIGSTDSTGIGWRQYLVSAFCPPHTNYPYAFRKHENC